MESQAAEGSARPPGLLAALSRPSKRLSMPPASKQDAIRIADLPAYVSEKLAQFDLDGDGLITVDEILHKGAEVEHLHYKARRSPQPSTCCLRRCAGADSTPTRRRGGTALFS